MSYNWPKQFYIPVILYVYTFVTGDCVLAGTLYLCVTLCSYHFHQYLSIHTYIFILLATLFLNLVAFGKLLIMLYAYDCVLYVGDFIIFKFSSTSFGYLGFVFTKINMSFFFLTLWVGFFVNIFLYIYMRAELLVERFVFFLNCFIISMSILLLSSNWLTLLLGWELIGVSSYLLINFWTLRVSTFKSAFKAFIFNKLSDFSLLTSLIIFSQITLEYSFSVLFLSKPLFLVYTNVFFNCNHMTLFCFFLMISAYCKSAQFGFHIWLPDSMEAPIPASALIHSATLVSAGIFLLLKFWSFIKYCYILYYFILFWSSFTALYGALIAISQTDLKKILAYSTISHCGYLMCSLFLENYLLTILYLYIHGVFKAFSFMALGNIIYSFAGVQDLTKVSNIFFFKKANFFFLTFSLLNLSAFPLTIGFFFKHLFIVNFFALSCNMFFLILLFCTSSIGFVYSFRILWNLFFSYFKFSFEKHSLFFINYQNVYIYNLWNIDYVISVILFFGLTCSLFIIFYIYYLLGSYYSPSSNLVTLHTTLSSLKLFLLFYNYLYIYYVYIFIKQNHQRHFFAQNNYTYIGIFPTLSLLIL